MEQGNIKERVAEFIHHKRLKMCEFEAMCGLSSGYIASMRKGFGSGKLNNVLRAFPDLNRDWLLYGEGEMLLPAATVQQHNVHGDNNAAHTITTSGDTATDKLLNIVTQSQHLATTAQEQTIKAQQHIDRLLAIIERLTDGQKMQMP